MRKTTPLTILFIVLTMITAPFAMAEGDWSFEQDALDTLEVVEELQDVYRDYKNSGECEESQDAEDWYSYSDQYYELAENSLAVNDYEVASGHAWHAKSKIEKAIDYIEMECESDEEEESDAAADKATKDLAYTMLQELDDYYDSVSYQIFQMDDYNCKIDYAREKLDYAKMKFEYADEYYDDAAFEASIEFVGYANEALDEAREHAVCDNSVVLDNKEDDDHSEKEDEAWDYVERLIQHMDELEEEADCEEVDEYLVKADAYLSSAEKYAENGKFEQAIDESMAGIDVVERGFTVECEEDYLDEEELDDYYDEMDEEWDDDYHDDDHDEHEDYLELEEEEELECDSGCMMDDKCLPVGYRHEMEGSSMYCGGDGESHRQMENGASCQNDFECQSNSCSSGECYDVKKEIEENRGLLNRILDWFSWLF